MHQSLNVVQGLTRSPNRYPFAPGKPTPSEREQVYGITQELLQQLFTYDESTHNKLVRKVYNRGITPGPTIGNQRRLRVKGLGYAVSRLVWILHNGNIPTGMEVDHVNRDRTDDRIENLRLVSPSVNCRNRRVSGATAFRGVSKHSNRRWAANVRLNGLMAKVGASDTPEGAAALFDAAVHLLFGLDNEYHPTNESEGLIPASARVDLPGKTAIRLAKKFKLPVVTIIQGADGKIHAFADQNYHQ